MLGSRPSSGNAPANRNSRAIAARLSAKPFIRVESSSFVSRFGDRDYDLGSTEGGVARAIHRMRELRREIEGAVA